MAKNLTGQAIRSTYMQLLHIDGGVDAVIKPVVDGDGTETAMKMSINETRFRRTLGVDGESGQTTDLLDLWQRFVVTSGGLVGVGINKPVFQQNNYTGVHVHNEGSGGAAYRLTTRPSGTTDNDGVDMHLDQDGTFYIWSRENASVVVAAANALAVQVAPGATSWSSASDERLKDITGSYDNALKDIAKLKPIKFSWKSDASKKPNVGLSAQSVQEVIPEAVDSAKLLKSDDPTEYLSVRYTEVIPLLVASIQELSAEVKALKAKK